MSTADSTRLQKKDIERLIQEKSASISFGKPKENTKTSKYWSKFSLIYVTDVKQDFIACDGCKSVLVYKSSTGSGCMVTHSRYCQSKGETDSSAQQRKIIDYVTSNAEGTKKIPKRIKDAITSSCVTFVVNDGRPFHLLQGHGLLHLAKQIYESGRLMSSSTTIDIEELLPDPTTVNRSSE
jgi:Hermes transposase DNA-binding domain